MSSGFESSRAQIQIELGLQGEGVISTAAEEMKGFQKALAEIGQQNREGILTGEAYLEKIRQIIAGMNQLTRDVKAAGDATELTDAQFQKHLKTMQQLAAAEDARAAAVQRATNMTGDQAQAQMELSEVRESLGKKEIAQTEEEHDARVQAWQDEQRLLQSQGTAEADLANVRAAIGRRQSQQTQQDHDAKVQAWQDQQNLIAAEAAAESDLATIRSQLAKQHGSQIQGDHDAKVQAWQDQQKLIADEKTAEADLATARAAIGKQETARIQAEHDAKVQAWQDQVNTQSRLDKEAVDHANVLLKQHQDALKLDAQVNKEMNAQARADDAELTRQIEVSVNPRMAASDRYRQSVDNVVQATKRAKDAELELAEAQEKHRKAAKEAADFPGSAYSAYPGAADHYRELIEKQIEAESELVGAQVKHAGSQAQVTDATQKAAAAQQAMQKGTQAGADSTMAWTRAVYFAAQGVEDLQYGFNAVVNNIPMVAMSIAQGLGKSAEAAMGFGAAISLAAVAINSVVIPAFKNFVDTHEDVKAFFDELGKQLNPFHVDTYVTSLDRMTDRIKELESKKIKVAVDMVEVERLTKEVDELRKATEAANAILNKQTAKEAQAGKNIAADLETEKGREELRDARQKSINTALANSQAIKTNDTKIREMEAAAEENEKTGGLVFTGTAFVDRSFIAQQQRREAKRLQEANEVAREKIEKDEGGRFDLDLNQARTGVGPEQANAQTRFLNNLRAAGQGALADQIAKDIANAQSGLGTQQEVSSDEADVQFDKVEESNKRAKDARLNRQREAKRTAKDVSDDADVQFQSVEESNTRARAARLKRRAAKKKVTSEAEQQRKQMESRIDDTGVQGQAFALFDQIGGMPRGKGRDQANAQADQMIQMMVQQMAMQDPTINPIQAQSMAANASALFRQRYGNQIAKQQALLGGGARGGNGMQSVGLGPDAGGGADDPMHSNVQATKIVEQSQQNMNAALLGYLANSDNTMQSLAAMQQDLIGKLNHFNMRMGQINQVARNNNGQLNDLRQNNQNWVP